MLWCFVRFARSVIATVLVGIFASASTAQSMGVDDAVQQFLHSVDEYMTLRRHLVHELPPLEVSDDAQRIDRAAEARAEVIRRARANARTGDVFTGASDLLRTRIHRALATPPCSVAATLREMNEHGERWQRAAVNDRFVWTTAAAMPPCVLAVLPALPRELQYRFVGPDLVLVDIEASVVLDVLVDVLDLSAADRESPPVRGHR